MGFWRRSKRTFFGALGKGCCLVNLRQIFGENRGFPHQEAGTAKSRVDFGVPFNMFQLFLGIIPT